MPAAAAEAVVEASFDPRTATVSYLVHEPATRAAAIVDPVLDFDFKSGRTGTESADRLLARVRALDLAVEWILETHAHADHLSAARHLKEALGGTPRIGIGENIRDVQATFKAIYNLERSFLPDGSQFDHLFADGELFTIGALRCEALHVPGHTPADVAYRVGSAVFVGDTLFMPDVGSARADFPGGSARQLYASAQRLLALPPETDVYVCHDYPPPGRGPAWRSSVAEQRARNVHLHDGIGEAAFVALRERRDATLEMPTLILPSIQVNVRAGTLPPEDDNGVRYLRIPLNVLKGRTA